MKIEIWPIGKPIPYARNARKIPQSAIDKVAGSLREFGWRQPIVVDKSGVIVAGHTRLSAAQKLGLSEVPVHIAADLTPTQIKAYRLADNRVNQESSFDNELLALDLADLKLEDFAMELTGFDAAEIEALNMIAEEVGMPDLASGDKQPFQQMTFTLHDEQAEQVKRAMAIAKQMGEFVDSPNENGNGNALARICEAFVTTHGNS